MKKVTLWYKVFRNENGELSSVLYNHLEDGWSENEKPQPISESFTNQKAWEKDEWIQERSYMTDDYYVFK